MEGVIEKRRRLREEAIREAREFVQCVESILEVSSAYLFGSYARGDFNAWSDVDVLVITRGELPESPVKRLEAIEDCLRGRPKVEPVVMTEEEYQRAKAKKNPIAVEAELNYIRLK